MVVHNEPGSGSLERLLLFGVLLVVGFGFCHGIEEFTSSSPDFASSVLEPLDGLRRYVESIVGTQAIGMCCESAVLYLDSMLGQENIYSFAMCVNMVLDFVAEGAASGLNVIAVYVSEILRATGMSDAVSIPHFTTEGVSAVISWALLALIGYWLFFFLLRLTVTIIQRIFWLIKVVVVLGLFMRIVNDPTASTEVTTMRLSLIVFICAVFGVAAGSGGMREGSLESRICRLEGKVNGFEKSKSE